jgi:ComF family protein
VRRLVQELKFRNKLHLARLLGQLMGSRLAAQEAGVELIIPVPLHRKRLCERGYNQALELAHAMAKQLNVPIDMESCVRTRATAAQSELSSEQRQKNVRGVFSLRKPIAAKTVAIVDDVMTTGATVTELARVLRQSGVQEVQVWVCARAPL